MSISEAELVKNGKLTSFYLKLLDNVNKKLDSKIDIVSQTLLSDFEKKKAELMATKKQLEELYKMRTSIVDINKFYKYNKPEPKRDVKSVHITNNPTIPNVTTKNILDTLDNIEVKIDGGDFMQLVQKSTTPTIANPTLLLTDSDKQLSSFTRLSIKKKSNVVKINEKQSGFETSQTNIVLHFKNHSINPEHINIRYLTLPNEPKQLFSYFTNILGSNDGQKWEPVCNINLGLMKNFEKTTLFKFPVSIKTPNFYKYICFQSQPTKEAVPKEQLPKLSNRPTIPVCNFEIFGNYYSNDLVGVDNKVDEDFQTFFDDYLNTTYSTASNKTEIEYLVKMMLETYKELTNVLSECKINNAVKQSASTSEADSDDTQYETIKEEDTVQLEEPQEEEQPKEEELEPKEEEQPKEDEDLSENLMELMSSVKNPYSDKKIKILDTESNSIVLSGNRNKGKKKRTIVTK